METTSIRLGRYSCKRLLQTLYCASKVWDNRKDIWVRKCKLSCIEMLTCFARIHFPLEKFPLKTWHQVRIVLNACKATKERVKMEAPSKTLTLFAIVVLNFLLLCRAIPFHCECLIFYSANFFSYTPPAVAVNNSIIFLSGVIQKVNSLWTYWPKRKWSFVFVSADNLNIVEDAKGKVSYFVFEHGPVKFSCSQVNVRKSAVLFSISFTNLYGVNVCFWKLQDRRN